jgi:hypothetical protein
MYGKFLGNPLRNIGGAAALRCAESQDRMGDR